MTQALVTLGLGSFGSVGQVVLVGLFTAPPPPGEPIDWIGFTARGSVSYASASGDVSEVTATGAQPVATITGRPYA